jgi:protein gp37
MADSTIEWTTKTWNPTTGCTKISQECKFCYAETLTNRYMKNPKQEKYKQGFGVFVMHEDALNDPLEWKKSETVFVNSMSDLFHEKITLDFLKKVFKVMNDTPNHTYQILTKREDILEKYSDELEWTDNIWMGISVGEEKSVYKIKSLASCGAKHKFLSVEPLIEELPDLDLKGIDWVIVGGESGSNKVRRLEKDWILKVKKNCDEQNVPFFFKQWGKSKFNPNPNDPTINKEHRYHSKGGSQLDGKIFWKNPTIKDDSIPMINVFGEEHFVMDEMEELNSIWELKSYLPMMEKELYNQLKANIRKNNLNDPILYFITEDGKKLVIEGHTRLKACIKLKKKKIPTKEVKEHFESLDDVKLWTVKHQFQRRNLSNVEKIQLAYLSKASIEKLAKENLSKAGKKTGITAAIDTNAEIAKIAGVGRTTVVRYNNVLDNASKAIILKLKNGNISISTAQNAIKNLPKKSKQLKVKSIKKDIVITVLQSIEDGVQKIQEETMEGIIILKDKTKTETLSNYQKRKFGIFFVE